MRTKHRGERHSHRQAKRPKLNMRMVRVPDLGNAPHDRLARAIHESEAKLTALAVEGRSKAGEAGSLVAHFDETTGQVKTLFVPLVHADKVVNMFDETVQAGYHLFSAMAMLAPWAVIVIGELYTSEDKTYSIVTTLDMAEAQREQN